ncbi:YtfJ family protein [Hydrogenimonas sp.]
MRRFITLLFLALPLLALEVGKPLPRLVLDGEAGGRVDGTPFESDALRGKVTVLFYVDPDKKSLNEAFTDALHAQHFDRSRYQSVAIVNMAATWMPNFAIASALKSKQKKFPDTIYVKDRHKKGVEVWRMHDDDANFAILSRDGEVLYFRAGKIPETDYETIFSIIRSAMR